MKKAVLILVALLLVSSFVFAEDAGVKIGAWGRGLFVPVMGGNDITTAAQASWGTIPRIGATISGTSANVGFQIDFNVDGKVASGVIAPVLTFGDQQKIWVKPIDMVTLQLGTIFDDTLRGSASFGAWNWVRYSFMSGDDAVFQRVGKQGWAPTNFEVSVAPMEGVYVFAALSRTNIFADTSLMTPVPAPLVKDVLAGGQYGAGYTIAGIGTIRAQYIGTNTDLGDIQAAFKVTAVDKLTADIGADIPLGLTSTGTSAITDNARIAAFLSYGLDALTLNAMANIGLPKTGDARMEFGAGVDYSVGDGVGVTADFRYANTAATTLANGAIGAMVGVTKGFSNGLIGLGVEISTANFAAGLINKAAAGDVAWVVPVRFEYWF